MKPVRTHMEALILERADNEEYVRELEQRVRELEFQLAEAAQEIPVVGSVAHRIRTLKREWSERITCLQAEVTHLRNGAIHQEHEIQQILGKTLGYPWFKDDPKNFPDATEADGVCVGEHVAMSLVDEAASRIVALRAEVTQLRKEDSQ